MATEKAVYDITSEEQDAIIRSEPVHEGFFQSLLFGVHMFANLRKCFVWKHLLPYTESRMENDCILSRPITIHDWGCGYGDGTAIIKTHFPTSNVTGFDYASECVKIARERWPHVRFEQVDIREADSEADVIFCSHLIEHTKSPPETIARLRSLCNWLIVVVPPIMEGHDGGHKGAAITDEWIAALTPPPIETVDYHTLRVNADHSEQIMEGHILMTFQGER